MRLSPAQTRLIMQCVRQQLGPDAHVMLFGSRLDDAARGGDVDLLVESEAPVALHQRMLATMALETCARASRWPMKTSWPGADDRAMRLMQ